MPLKKDLYNNKDEGYERKMREYINEALEYQKQHHDEYLSDIVKLLKIPSVSTEPGYQDSLNEAALWLKERLVKAGLQNAQFIEPSVNPLVYAEWLHAEDAPTILIYGHYDVQGAGPEELWDTPPFSPVVENGVIKGRGACDDKGQLMIAVSVIESMLKTRGELPCNVKILFEGEEEILGPSFRTALENNKEKLKCDIVFSVDGGQKSETEPSLLLGTRGMCSLQVDVYAANQDLHSGIFGGIVHNPAIALSHILASVRDPDGTILVEGFSEDVRPITKSETKGLSMPYEATEIQERYSLVSLLGNEKSVSVERVNFLPTLDVNGIWSGFSGSGPRSIIPGSAHALISCRLVPDQNPQDVLEKLASHIRRTAPEGVKVDTTKQGGTAVGYSIPREDPYLCMVESVLSDVYGRKPVYLRDGGSNGVLGNFRDILEVNTVVLGFILSDENIHSPNEFFRIDSFLKGQKVYTELFHKLLS